MGVVAVFQTLRQGYDFVGGYSNQRGENVVESYGKSRIKRSIVRANDVIAEINNERPRRIEKRFESTDIFGKGKVDLASTPG